MIRSAGAALAGSLLLAQGALAQPADRAFLVEDDAAMSRMMQAMVILPTGDINRDFVAMMAAHHQGAIDMATSLLRHGGNEQLRRLAQEIIVTQQQEIVAMRFAIGASLTPPAPAPTQVPAIPVPASPPGR
ncbi:MAG: DUF305 domain-containing protein [Janthinobacterium lividum]